MIQEALPHLPSDGKVKKSDHNYSPEIESVEDSKKSSTLIEFPGGRSVPEWRKQLSKRVREVQERKAREAAEELAALQEAGLVSCALPSGQLELVPDLENPVVNPIVSKALERIERARRTDYSPTTTATLTPEAAAWDPTEVVDARVVETKRKLTVVAPSGPPVVEPTEIAPNELMAVDSIDPTVESTAPEAAIPEPSAMESTASELMATESMSRESIATESIAKESLATESLTTGLIANMESTLEAPIAFEVEEPPVRQRMARKPIRVISDNDVALSYLETCLSVPALASDTRTDIAGLSRRFFAGIVDLLLIAVIVSPAAAGFDYAGANWAEPKTIGIMAGITAVVMFAYLTICIAMTGRTPAMRIFRMRTIDLRTGLIPTGGQSITRAITYVFSFALLGLGIAYAVIDPDKRTVYDRASKTIVIRS